MDKVNNVVMKIRYYIRKNIFVVFVPIGLCPILALSYAKFTINSESYRSNEMYISELLYSIKIDNENTYTIDIEPGETEHTIEITSLNAISTNYKLAYLNNSDLDVKYASDYLEPSLGGILTSRTISLTIKNTSNEKQILSLMVFGGYGFNNVDEVEVLDTYTEIKSDYWKYDYETTALYVNNTRVNKLDSSKKYNLVNYTCSDDAKVSYESISRSLTIVSDNQIKCSLYFEEVKESFAQHLIKNYEGYALTKISQAATGNQNYATSEYRYQGKNPNNYITFNDETGKWRIIGVFEVQTLNSDGTYTKEYKVKIVRDTIATLVWNQNANNDWTSATSQILLNSGDYYNRSGSYANIGLTDKAKSQITSTKFYLGYAKFGSSGFANTANMYTQERSTSVLSGRSQTWDGKVALIYPSDYMYASSGCYNNSTMLGFSYSGSSYDYRNTTCTSTNWLFIGSTYCLISYPSNGGVYTVIMAGNIGNLTGDSGAGSTSTLIRPTLYLSSSTEYISGSGSSSDPFIIY